jgi:hypothetical protein
MERHKKLIVDDEGNAANCLKTATSQEKTPGTKPGQEMREAHQK